MTAKTPNQSKIIAFISSSDDLGMATLLSDVAAAISALDKQVTLVDVARASSPGTGRFIPETDTSNKEKKPSVCEVLPSGIRVLTFDGNSVSEDDDAAGEIELLHELSVVADYLLVDLPFKPTPLARSILSDCDLIIVASSCKFENINETLNVVKALLFLGIAAEKIAAILVDPCGILPSASLADIKPYLEGILGIELAGVVSFDASVYELSCLESQPIIYSHPGSQLARDIRQLAQYIMPHDCRKQEPARSGAKTPYLEKGY